MTEPQQKIELLLSEISNKLTVLIAISLRQLENEKLFEKSRKIGETARYLGNMGLDAKTIADVVGAPLSSIRTLLTPSQKEKSKSK